MFLNAVVEIMTIISIMSIGDISNIGNCFKCFAGSNLSKLAGTSYVQGLLCSMEAFSTSPIEPSLFGGRWGVGVRNALTAKYCRQQYLCLVQTLAWVQCNPCCNIPWVYKHDYIFDLHTVLSYTSVFPLTAYSHSWFLSQDQLHLVKSNSHLFILPADQHPQKLNISLQHSPKIPIGPKFQITFLLTRPKPLIYSSNKYRKEIKTSCHYIRTIT